MKAWILSGLTLLGGTLVPSANAQQFAGDSDYAEPFDSEPQIAQSALEAPSMRPRAHRQNDIHFSGPQYELPDFEPTSPTVQAASYQSDAPIFDSASPYPADFPHESSFPHDASYIDEGETIAIFPEPIHCGCEGPCSGECEHIDESSGVFEKLHSRLGSRSIDDPWLFLGNYCGYTAGGWAQLGYHSKALPSFNSRPHDFQLQQAWLYFEKEANVSDGFGVGGRIDYVYGTDAPDTQAFGINNDHWDNSWDHGPDYGNAIPQLYLEAGYGDWMVKVGHFFTTIGHEVVAAPDNFFYSHAYTMYNSEPFTHTGALATYSGLSHAEVFGGYVMGWDSGFEDNGDAFLGGMTVDLTRDIKVTSSTIGGVFAKSRDGQQEQGIMHSVVTDVALTGKMHYIVQGDLLDTENASGATVRDTLGINQYLIRTLGDQLTIGARFEWWQATADSQGYYGNAQNLANLPAGYDLNDEDFDFYAFTLGLNYRPHANVVIRPEIRWDTVFGGTDAIAAVDSIALQDNDKNQTTFGIDSIFTF